MDTPTAIVIKLPAAVSAKDVRKLGRDLKSKMMMPSPCVIVDLSRVKKIDLQGLEVLLSCMEEIAKQDGALQLRGVTPEVATLLELTRMDRLFQKFPGFSLDAASIAFASETAAEEEEQPQTSVQVPVAA